MVPVIKCQIKIYSVFSVGYSDLIVPSMDQQLSGCRKEQAIHLPSKNAMTRFYHILTDFRICQAWGGSILLCLYLLLEIKIYTTELLISERRAMLTTTYFLFFVSYFPITGSQFSFIDHAFAELGIGGFVAVWACLQLWTLLVGCGDQCYHYLRDKVGHILNMTGPQSKH